MKKIALSVFAALAACTAFAQQSAGSLSLAPHIGLGGIISTEKLVGDTKGMVAAIGGVEATYMMTETLGISAGFDYGFASTGEETYKTLGIEYTEKLDFGMINLPILAQLHFGNFAVKAGIQPGWIISPEGHLEYKDGSTKVSKDTDLKNINHFQLMVPVGISYTLSNHPIQFDLRYNIGTTKFCDKDKVKENNPTLSSIMLSVGYRFDLGF